LSDPGEVAGKGKQERPKAGGNKKAEVASPADGQKMDYIHVRARRGQATDSHSLAERVRRSRLLNIISMLHIGIDPVLCVLWLSEFIGRMIAQVRRERISERMKYLQELVPGCSKVTGKAGMLDEIINYVQSLQKQVEVAARQPRALCTFHHLCFFFQLAFSAYWKIIAAVVAVPLHEDRRVQSGGELRHRRGPLRQAAEAGVQPCSFAGDGPAGRAAAAVLRSDEPHAAGAPACKLLWL
jgi:hypothetical protein